jgi:hypothetical protein
MTGMVKITIDQASLDAARRELAAIPRAMERACVSAVNDTVRQGVSLAARRIAKASGLKVGWIRKKGISFIRATLKHAAAAAVVSSRKLPVRMLSPRKRAKGIDYKNPLAGGQRTLIAGAFRAKRKAFEKSTAAVPTTDQELAAEAARVNVFKRVGRKRLPIKTQAGPTLAEVVRSPWFELERAIEEMKIRLRDNLVRRVRLQVLRKEGRAAVKDYMSDWYGGTHA